ncbi:hypothetical protein PFISCL1PPCAC_28520, partial [Pristionchus fissidentatus]
SADYAEERLSESYELPPKVQETAASVARIVASNGAILSGLMTGQRLPENCRKSPLEKWGEQEEQSRRPRRRRELRDDRANSPPRFPLLQLENQIVSTVARVDVVCLIAPTGCGKSVLAPYLADLIFDVISRSSSSSSSSSSRPAAKQLRKTMMCVPNGQHCGSTARNFDKFFGHTGMVADAFLNPYERTSRRGPIECDEATADMVLVSYNTAIRVLPTAQLGLLILDEIHEANDNVQVTVAMALKMLKGSPFSADDTSFRAKR